MSHVGQGRKIRVFISYNVLDREVADVIATHLAFESDVDVWYGEWDLHPGDSITQKISLGLKEADVFILLWSKNASKSKWVNKEWQSILAERLQKNKKELRIIPIVIGTATLPAILSDVLFLKHENSEEFLEDLLESVLRSDPDFVFFDFVARFSAELFTHLFFEMMIDLGSIRPNPPDLTTKVGRKRLWKWTTVVKRGSGKKPHEYREVGWDKKAHGPQTIRSKHWVLSKKLMSCPCGATHILSKIQPRNRKLHRKALLELEAQ